MIEKSYMFGENKAFINISTNVYVNLHKRYTALSFHRVCEAIASKYVSFNFILGLENPSDILCKHWSYNYVKDVSLPISY